MKGNKIYFVFFFVLFFLNTAKLLAQEKNADTRIYQKAVDAFEQKNFASSISLLETLLKKNERNAEATLFLYQVYAEDKQYQKSINAFEKLMQIDTTIFLPYIVKYASQYMVLGNYDKAASILESYKSILPSYLKSKAAELLSICSYAQMHPTQSEIKVTNVGDSVNTCLLYTSDAADE